MKAIRNKDSKAAVERIQARCIELNPNTEKALSPFLFRFLTVAEAILFQAQWEEVAKQLTSDRIVKKRKLERLKELISKADESDLEKFEQKLERKKAVSNSNLSKISAENS